MAFSITYAANRFPESVVIGMDLAFFITITQAAVNMRFIADGNNLLYLQTLGKQTGRFPSRGVWEIARGKAFVRPFWIS